MKPLTVGQNAPQSDMQTQPFTYDAMAGSSTSLSEWDFKAIRSQAALSLRTFSELQQTLEMKKATLAGSLFHF